MTFYDIPVFCMVVNPGDLRCTFWYYPTTHCLRFLLGAGLKDFAISEEESQHFSLSLYRKCFGMSRNDCSTKSFPVMQIRVSRNFGIMRFQKMRKAKGYYKLIRSEKIWKVSYSQKNQSLPFKQFYRTWVLRRESVVLKKKQKQLLQ